MKRFEEPMMNILKLNAEEVMRTSGCMVEAVACLDCYCSGVTCEGIVTCDKLVCPTLEAIQEM